MASNPADSQPKFAGIIEGPLALAAAITAVLASTVGLLYVIGGTVMWLRFHEAGLPADRAVALVPKDDLLILGLRVMVIPALLSGGFLLLLGSVWRAREMRLAQLLQRKQEEESKLADEVPDADEPERRKRVAKLEKDIERGRQPLLTAKRIPRPGSNPIWFTLLVVLAVGLVLVVPFSVGSLAWPVVLVGLLAYWLHLRPDRLSPEVSRFPVWRLALAAVLGAVILSIARQTDRPVELLSVRAEVKSPSTLVQQTLGLHNARRERGRTVAGDVSGVLVAVTGSVVAIGDPTDRAITTIPRSSVTAMTIGPPLDQRGPPASLLSRVLRDDGWAVTPLELWCSNLRYDWSRIGHACGLAPTVETDDPLTIRGDRIRGIKVTCPKSADEGCRGFVLVVTRKSVASGANVLPLEFPAQPFAIDAGRSRFILVPVERDALFAQLTDGTSDQRVDVRVRLTMEAAGEAVVKRTSAQLLVPAPRHPRKPRPTPTPTPTPTDTTAGGGGGPGPAASASPEPSAAPEPSPTDSDPLPPQQQTMPAATPTLEP